MRSVEDLVDQAVATLQARLSAQLAAVNAEYAGGPHEITLAAPRDEDYYPGGVGTVLRYPTVEIAAPDLAGDAFSIDQHESDVHVTMIVRAWLQHPRFDVLYRMTNRYGSAIYNALVQPDQATGRGTGFGPETSVTRYTVAYRWNPQTNELDQVTSAVLLAFYIDAPDVRP